MLPSFARHVATIITALGIFLGGFGPVMAVPQGPGMPQMAMMPGMAMQASCVTKAKCPARKPMTSDGTDCGCCLAGTCAAPVALDQAGLAQLLGRTAERQIAKNTVLSGITFPPALPPPID